VDSRSGNAYENRNPADTDELIGMFVSSTAEDVDLAVDAANLAYKKWRLVPLLNEPNLFRAAEMLLAHKNPSPRHDREMGKVLAETRGDVQEAIDMTTTWPERVAASLGRPLHPSCPQIRYERPSVHRQLRA